MVLLNPGIVLFALNRDTVLQVLFNPIVSDDGVRSEVVLRKNLDSNVFILANLIHHDVWVSAYSLHSHMALRDLT
jgi:hypothetical protein